MSLTVPLADRYPFYPLLNIEGERKPQSDELLCSSIVKMQSVAANSFNLCDWVNTVKYKFEDIPQGGLTIRGLVRLNPNNLTEWTVVYELAHAWDASQDWQISKRMRNTTHSGFYFGLLHNLYPDNSKFWYHVGSLPPPCAVDQNFDSLEDFAESVTAFLFAEEAHLKASKRGFPYEVFGFTDFHDTPRGQFVKTLFG